MIFVHAPKSSYMYVREAGCKSSNEVLDHRSMILVKFKTWDARHPVSALDEDARQKIGSVRLIE